MGRETTARIIAELEAVGRTRALTDQESWRLQKMVSLEGRYERRAARMKLADGASAGEMV